MYFETKYTLNQEVWLIHEFYYEQTINYRYDSCSGSSKYKKLEPSEKLKIWGVLGKGKIANISAFIEAKNLIREELEVNVDTRTGIIKISNIKVDIFLKEHDAENICKLRNNETM